jgi:hypothetical protein
MRRLHATTANIPPNAIAVQETSTSNVINSAGWNECHLTQAQLISYSRNIVTLVREQVVPTRLKGRSDLLLVLQVCLGADIQIGLTRVTSIKVGFLK